MTKDRSWLPAHWCLSGRPITNYDVLVTCRRIVTIYCHLITHIFYPVMHLLYSIARLTLRWKIFIFSPLFVIDVLETAKRLPWPLASVHKNEPLLYPLPRRPPAIENHGIAYLTSSAGLNKSCPIMLCVLRVCGCEARDVIFFTWSYFIWRKCNKLVSL